MNEAPAARRCTLCDSPGPFARVFGRSGYQVVRCPGCGLIFQDPQPGKEVLARSYYHDPAFSEALLGPLREVTLERAGEKADLLRAAGALKAGARALDVGCSSGAWLEVARGAGLHPVGVEIGAATAAGARDRGLDVRTGTLEEALAGLAHESFDLITFWDVLEHLRDPVAELRMARDLLAPGGSVAATFPNVEGWYPRLTRRVLTPLTGVWEHAELPVHLYDFGPETTRELFEGRAFTVVHLRTVTTPFDFYRETTLSPEHLGPGARGKLVRAAFEALRAVVYPLARRFDRANALFVVAERRAG